MMARWFPAELRIFADWRSPRKGIEVFQIAARASSDESSQDMHIADPYVEIIGNVKDDLSVKALTSINMGSKLGKSFLG